MRRAPGWFALESRITPRKGERVQERIAWIIGKPAGRSARTGRILAREASAGGRSISPPATAAAMPREIADITREGAAV